MANYYDVLGKIIKEIVEAKDTEKKTMEIPVEEVKVAKNTVNKKVGEEVRQTVSENKGEYKKMHGWKKIINELNGKNGVKLVAEKEKNNKDYTAKVEFSSLTEKHHISVPNKIDIFDGLDITERDRLYVTLGKIRFFDTVVLINGENDLAGLFKLKSVVIDGKQQYILTADARELFIMNNKSSKYYFAFLGMDMQQYKVPVEVNCQELMTASTHLCIDFGTSNTTAGCFLDDSYVDNISNIAVINGNVTLNSENIVKFIVHERDDGSDMVSFSSIVPTIVYVEDCSDKNDIIYSFGYDAARKVKEDNYCPQASCFMEIKRWTSNIDVNEEIKDSKGNKAVVSRKEIISKYLMFVIKNAQNQFKCRFRNVHISAPVKLKEKVLGLYAEILEKNGYVLEQKNAIDEGIAVLFSIINNQIQSGNYNNDREEKALIIDCGGGTSDLASCRYKIEKDEDGIINLDIVTQHMNGDVNFGGNNITYRIMQYMKIVYAHKLNGKRVNVDDIIKQDINSIFSYIEGEIGDDNDVRVKERYEEVYKILNKEYEKTEKIIPTRYKEHENEPKEIYDKIKNNFYFLWKLAEEMKKEFYRTSISRYTFQQKNDADDIDLHTKKIENWRISVMQNGVLKEQGYPNIIYNAKEIDKILRADIYYLIRKFLNPLYNNRASADSYSNELDTYSQIKLSGQSSKINIFMDALKEFLPGKKIKSGRIHSKDNEAEELKLTCLKGAVMYLHSLEKSNIEVTLQNETRNIPVSVYIRNQNGEDKEMFCQGFDWNQPAQRRRITNSGKEIYLHMRNIDKDVREPYKYVYENISFARTNFDELTGISKGKISQDMVDEMPVNKKYIFVFLDKEKWGFDILPVYKDEKAKLYRGDAEFCSFEMDILQNTFFDGRK